MIILTQISQMNGTETLPILFSCMEQLMVRQRKRIVIFYQNIYNLILFSYFLLRKNEKY